MGLKQKGASRTEVIYSSGLVGRSENLYKAVIHAKQTSVSGSRALLHGEFGTELDSLLRIIHGDRTGALIRVDCAYREPQSLLKELTLDYNRTGVSQLQRATGGTLVLTGIDEICANGQSIMRGVLDEIERNKLDLKLIFTTQLTPQEFEQKVAKNQFDTGLFFRVNWLRFHLLPLRERPEDIIPLAQHFRNLKAQSRPGVGDFHASALKEIESWPWPGNLDSLQTAVGQLLDFNPGEIITSGHLRDDTYCQDLNSWYDKLKSVQ